MEFLTFQLRAAMASWGDTAVGEYRGSHEYPSESALLGIIAAALGIRRDEEQALTALRDGYGFTLGVQSTGSLLRDYHTAQVPGRPALKGRPHTTRKDELALPKRDLNTILSTRDYRLNSACLIAVQAHPSAPYSLEKLAATLRVPRFVLYAGRKSCPLGAPLFPQIMTTKSARAALDAYRERLEGLHQTDEQPHSTKGFLRIVWSDGVDAGVTEDFSTQRKDRVIRRRGWLFSDRTEHTHFPDGRA